MPVVAMRMIKTMALHISLSIWPSRFFTNIVHLHVSCITASTVVQYMIARQKFFKKSGYRLIQFIYSGYHEKDTNGFRTRS